MANNRIPRVNELIKRELNDVLLKQIDFPEGTLVTITRVETSSNLIQTRIYISVIPEEKREEVIQVLKKKIFDIQKVLNKRLKMRPIPKIIFVEERKTKEAGKIEEILKEIEENN